MMIKTSITRDLELWTSPEGGTSFFGDTDGLQYPVSVSLEIQRNARQRSRGNCDDLHLVD